MRSKRTSPEEQLRLITECHQSGLTDYEWCQQHNIKVSTFYVWVHRLKQSGEIDIPAVMDACLGFYDEYYDFYDIGTVAEPMIGSWENIAPEAVELHSDAQAAFDKATEGRDEYIPVALLSRQVVAGTNYCILCQITPVVPDATSTWALVYIYADLDGNAEITNVYELYIDRHSTPAD